MLKRPRRPAWKALGAPQPRGTAYAEDFARLVRLKRLREPGRAGARPAVLH